MSVAEALKSAQFLVNGDGKQTAVFLNIEAWDTIINWIEDITDTQIAVQALTDLQTKGGRPETAGWLAWDEISEEWDDE